jgi:uncharacterized protein YciI
METVRVVHLSNVNMTDYPKHLPAHVDWVTRYAEQGVFLFAGALTDPSLGGCIIAAGLSESQLDSALAEDPFLINGIASHQVSAFSGTRGALIQALHQHCSHLRQSTPVASE